MILKSFYEESLAQASFLVGCARTGEAIVIDGNRDVEQYIRTAAAEGLRITAVTESHIHADYVSGSRELAERTGATLHLSDEGDAAWKYAFADQRSVRLVRHGDVIRAGHVRLDVVRTPGHTPEHISFILTDEPASAEPLGVFTGDFVFVGDVGRPDLLERAAHVVGTMEAGARTLFRSLQTFKALPDRLLLWPGHGSGSACGKSLGGVPVSTLGYERLVNWGLRAQDEDRFVADVLAGQPEPPAYFKEMKRINKEGPQAAGRVGRPPRISGGKLQDLPDGAVLVDIRSVAEVAAGYIPGSITIPLSKTFVTWAGSLLPYDRPVYLVASDEGDASVAARELALIGIDDVRGWLGPDAPAEWQQQGRRFATVASVTAREAAERAQRQELAILDVRGQREYEEGHVPGARHIPLGSLPSRTDELPQGRIVVHCASGARATIAISLLTRAGVESVVNMIGGFGAYQAAGLPIETGAGAQQVVQSTSGKALSLTS